MKVDFGWEKEEEKLKRYLKMPAKKKLEWLKDMHDFYVRYVVKRNPTLREKRG